MSERTLLSPVQVPWGISASNDWFEFSTTWDRKLIVVVAGSMPRTQAHSRKGDAKTRDREPHELMDNVRITITFSEPLYLKLITYDQGREELNAAQYDSSLIEGIYRRLSPSDFHTPSSFLWNWIETGICPDPYFYEGINSHWLKALANPFLKNYKHFIITGAESYMEVLSPAWKQRVSRTTKSD